MPNSFLSNYIFKHAWAPTVEGAFNKYPNEYQPNVLCLDILDRKLDDDGKLVTEKLLVSNFEQSETMKKAMRTLGIPIKDRQVTLEISSLDLIRKRYTMRSLNHTYFDYIKIHEQLDYSVDMDQSPEDFESGENTLLTQSTLVDMDPKQYSIMVRWAVNLIEKLCLKVAANNMPKGRIAMNKIIPNLMQEFDEITHFTEIVEDLETLIKKKVEGAEQMLAEFGDLVLDEVNKVQEDMITELKDDQMTERQQHNLNSNQNQNQTGQTTTSLQSKINEINQNLNSLSQKIAKNSQQTQQEINLIINDAKLEIQKLVTLLKKMMEQFAENLKSYADNDCLAYNKEALLGMKKFNELESQITEIYVQAIRKIDEEVVGKIEDFGYGTEEKLNLARQIKLFEEKFDRECRIGTSSYRIW